MTTARLTRLTRRTMLGSLSLPWLLSACGTPLPIREIPPGDAAAAARLRDSAQAHGLDAFRALSDINISYAGEWRPLIDRIQPELVDAGFRGRSQERLMPRIGVVAQHHTGPKGRKHVTWSRGERSDRYASLGDVAVWFNGVRSNDPAAQDTAALVAEGYSLFLLGPCWLIDRSVSLRTGGTERVDGRPCDVIDAWIRPGLGRVESDRVSAYIDLADGLLRRVRFTLEGFANTTGAVAEVDCFDHERRFGVIWPTRWHERLVHPFPLPVHDWRLTGLDVDRGYPASDLRGAEFSGAAAAPARPLPARERSG